jgi:methylglutaconyl-CoA hydratase
MLKMNVMNAILLSYHIPFVTLTLNRPETHNAFDDVMIAEITDTLEEIAARDDITTMILQSTGKSFSAGADLNWMKRAANYSEDQNREDALKLAQMLNNLYRLPQLTIACVQGAAMGGGLGLIACCDIVLASNTAMFSLSEVKLGLIPATIGPYVIRAIGARQAGRYFQTAERFDALTAQRIGLVHEICAGALDEKLQDILKASQSNGPLAMRAAKKLCHDLIGEIDEATMHDTASRIAAIRTRAEAQTRHHDFLNKKN